MKLKVIGKISILAIIGLCLIACGRSTKNKSANGNRIFNGKLEKNVTIKVLENDTAISKGYFSELIKAFNEEYADKGIKAVDANTDQHVDLANDGPYGYGPDVLYQANDVIMKYVEKKHVYPLPIKTLDAYKTTSEKAWSAFEIQKYGKTYICGVPVNVQSSMLYYRKDLLPADWKERWDKNKNGIPDMTETWSDLVKFSKERHMENSSQYGYMESLYDTYFSSGYLFSYGGYIFGKKNTDTKDIGFAKGEAEKGAKIIQQLAAVMNEESIDDTIKTSAYSKLGNGTYFATMSTPDVYSTFLDELKKNYESQGQSSQEAEKNAKANLVMTTLPQLPKSGDLTDTKSTLIPTKSMGGVNGYAISAYTKAPNASLAFINFATRYKMIVKRYEKLGIVPTRKDVVDKLGGISKDLYSNLEKNNIILMPSISAVSQIWTPTQTYFADITKDVFRPKNEKKYKSNKDLKDGLSNVSKQISDAIHTLE
ncbi:sugar ABC transporter substrate-binding protein [Streptococcus anginosus]|uniref:sugar ABC transporter substrate-binding protein n=1 Tax=Streptococcus anginosus TaxID=1328 RepID=UPI0021F8E69D|nr:extracellular solute-binding protein [Streptococcus anginosus]MCW0929492.1 sugar ABC transporter substrate-binding protein [Streptococcus anginosus]MCW0952031.1 sugar ABC transporter substrate-binding protein [Streptococcus anginosus]MCW0999601.1 sugar ABC transporter substrate-binding protein [Streptococcus anginosus]MED5831980.1 extracellular solute-binding protein [Streptococcus anginosus]